MRRTCACSGGAVCIWEEGCEQEAISGVGIDMSRSMLSAVEGRPHTMHRMG